MRQLLARIGRTTYRQRAAIATTLFGVVLFVVLALVVPEPADYRPTITPNRTTPTVPAPCPRNTATIVRGHAANGTPLLPVVPQRCSGPAYRRVVVALRAMATYCERSGQGAGAWAEANPKQPGGYEVVAQCEGRNPAAPTTVAPATARTVAYRVPRCDRPRRMSSCGRSVVA